MQSGGIALLHPGAMGSRVGGELVAAGFVVRWLSPGRSAQTVERAQREGLVATATPDELVREADIVLSICPPQVALDVAGMVAGEGFAGTYVDANPVSPGVLAEIASVVHSVGATFVDAGIVGPPPGNERRTHLYLSGPPAVVAEIADLWAATAVTPMNLGPRIGAASAAKQSYALYNKGRQALALLAAELAAAHGVEHILAAEGGRAGVDPLSDLDGLRDGLARTAWRWGPELDEIAATLTAAGLDPSPAHAVAAFYDRLGAPTEP